MQKLYTWSGVSCWRQRTVVVVCDMTKLVLSDSHFEVDKLFYVGYVLVS